MNEMLDVLFLQSPEKMAIFLILLILIKHLILHINQQLLPYFVFYEDDLSE